MAPPPSPDDIVLLDMMIRGKVVLPETFEYDCQLKKMHDVAYHSNTPLFFVLCHDTVDVQQAIKFVVKHELPISVRSGGHSPCGSSCRSGTVVIDLGGIHHVNYNDDATETVTLGPGATLSDLNVELMRCGRMTPVGVAPPTGCGGLVLHGGVGWLTNRFGTSVDNVVGVTVVLADGTVKELNHDSMGDDCELFFGVRGAAGVLGVVTSITMRTYPMEMITGGFWMMTDDTCYTETRILAKKLNSTIVKQEEANDRNIFGAIIMANFPPDPSIPQELHGAPCTAIFLGVWGTDEASVTLANEFVDRQVVFGKPPAPMPFQMFNQITSGMFLKFPPFSTYWKGQMLQGITGDKIDELADKWKDHDPIFNASLVGFEFTGGKAGAAHGKKINEGNDHCVSSLREYSLDVAVFLYYPPAGHAKRAKEYARELASVVENLKNTSYSNFSSELVNEETKREIGLSFSNAKRVEDIKQKVDPNGLFVRKVIPTESTPSQ